MGYSTLGQMLRWMEVPSGLTIRENRCELVDLANRVRMHFYNLYETVPEFLDIEQCYQVQKYCWDCHDCEDEYFGITLDSDVENIESIWINSNPIRMFDYWREYRDGLQPNCHCEIKLFDKGDGFSTELDMDCCKKGMRLKFMAENHHDKGKIVSIRYIGRDGEEKQEDVKLDTRYISTEGEAITVCRNGGVVLPIDLEGGVYLAQEDGRVISRYGARPQVPSFRRYKLTNVCCDDQVLVRSARRFHELYFDKDVIETDNRLAIEEATRFFRFNDSTRGDRTYEAKAATHAENAKNYLLGEKARERAKSTISQFRMNYGDLRYGRSGLRVKRGSPIPYTRHRIR